MATNSASSALRQLERGESCAYLQPDSVTGCRAPRACRSCLETAGCMIDFAGGCVSQEIQAANSALLYDRAIAAGLALPNATASRAALSAPQAWLFPAGVVRYCDTSQDAVCRECARTNFWQSKYAYPDSRFCVSGEESARCVCIDVCERPWIAKPDCSSQSALTPGAAPTRVVMVGDGTSNYSGTARAVFYAFLGATFFVVITLGLMVRARLGAAASIREAQGEARRRRDQARRERRNALLGVNPLSLTGWEAYRRELIGKEAVQLAATGADGKSGDESSASTAAASTSDGDESSHREESEAAYIRVADEDATTPGAASAATSELAALTPARPLLLAPNAFPERQPPAA